MSEPHVVTPEAVALETDVAGLGSRFMAALLDAVIQGGVVIVAVMASAPLGIDTVLIVVSVASFSMLFIYPTVMEAGTRGKTVGKMAARIRVVQVDGRPITLASALVRNLLRLVDLLPAVYAVGATSIFVTKRAQRLGDLAAGTVVVYDAPAPVPQELRLPESPGRDRMAREVDVAGLTSEEYSLVRSFLLRRESLRPEARARLAADLASRLRPRIGAPGSGEDPETLLEAVAEAYRGRWQP